MPTGYVPAPGLTPALTARRRAGGRSAGPAVSLTDHFCKTTKFTTAAEPRTGLIELTAALLSQTEDTGVPLRKPGSSFLHCLVQPRRRNSSPRVALLPAAIYYRPLPDGLAQPGWPDLLQAAAGWERQYRLTKSAVPGAGRRRHPLCPPHAGGPPGCNEWIHQYFLRGAMPVRHPRHPSHLPAFAEQARTSPSGWKAATPLTAVWRCHCYGRRIPRVVKLPEDIAGKPNCFIFLSSMLHAHIGELFSGMAIRGLYQFRRPATASDRRRR